MLALVRIIIPIEGTTTHKCQDIIMSNATTGTGKRLKLLLMQVFYFYVF
jgi:hypothetical protein